MKSCITLFLLFNLVSIATFAQKAELVKTKNVFDHQAPLFAHSWSLTELNGISTLQPGVKQAYITFQQGEFGYIRISGFTGCNYLGGRINLPDNDGIVFHPDLLTNDNCAGSTVESPLMQILLNADSWSEKNGQLLLHRKGKVVARWNPSNYVNANLNGAWQLVYLSGLAAPFSEIYSEAQCPGLIFSQGQNAATGYSGCHEYLSPFLINQQTIVFTKNTPCDTTCQVNEDNIFLQTLSSVNAYYFKDEKTLVLINDSQPVMAFQRRKIVPPNPTASSKE